MIQDDWEMARCLVTDLEVVADYLEPLMAHDLADAALQEAHGHVLRAMALLRHLTDMET
jgi:hypothetical protein